MMIKQALANDCTHILFLDDDLAFKSDLLLRLLAHDKDIVSGYYLLRNYPHQPILFDFANEKGECRHMYPTDDQIGLVEAVAFGLGACLIKTSVFKAMQEPWIRLGELEKDHWCDDIGFFRRVREHGFKMYCDLNAPVGHMASVTIWPNRTPDNKWVVVYDTNSPHGNVAFPALRPQVG
jgi:GT2 family glycosyltransferase